MWQLLELESTQTSIKFRLKHQDELLSYGQFLHFLEESHDFRSLYNKYLSEFGFRAFFWENRPVTRSALKAPYECNLIKSEFLAGQLPDHQTFDTYFRDDKSVVSFSNLGNDAQLIAPCPQKDYSVYTHIGNFVRDAGESQIQDFWKKVGQETSKHISDEPKWLSTSGLGVFWLHVRIDSYPKYYQTKEYKSV